jgi:hypothetical protein
MTTRTMTTKALVVTAAIGLLAACGGSGDDGDKAKTGTLKLGITDAPVDYAESVVVQFTGVELKPVEGAPFAIDFTPAKNFDLLDLTGTTRAMLVDGVEIPAGDYEWVRLKVNADPNVGNDSYVVLDSTGEQCEIRIPSGDQTGLKLVRGFTVAVGAITDFTIDFDLRKSLVAPPGQKTIVNTCGNQAFLLKPVLRMVNNLQVGAISGTVDAGLITAKCPTDNSDPYPGNVYLFGPIAADAADTTVTPDDYDGIANDPNGTDALVSAMVDPNTGNYTIGFVAPGRYKVAYTCDIDDIEVDADLPQAPEEEETVDFTPPAGVAVDVAANAVKDVDFPPPAP